MVLPSERPLHWAVRDADPPPQAPHLTARLDSRLLERVPLQCEANSDADADAEADLDADELTGLNWGDASSTVLPGGVQATFWSSYKRKVACLSSVSFLLAGLVSFFTGGAGSILTRIGLHQRTAAAYSAYAGGLRGTGTWNGDDSVWTPPSSPQASATGGFPSWSDFPGFSPEFAQTPPMSSPRAAILESGPAPSAQGKLRLLCWTFFDLDSPMEHQVLFQQVGRSEGLVTCDHFRIFAVQEQLVGTSPGGLQVMTTPIVLDPANVKMLSKDVAVAEVCWEWLLSSKDLSDTDFVVQVKPTTVLLPERVRKQAAELPDGELYLGTCQRAANEALEASSAIQVLSKQAIYSYSQSKSDCRSLPWKSDGESFYMQLCLDFAGVPREALPRLLKDPKCDLTRGPSEQSTTDCTSSVAAAFAELSDPSSWQQCYEDALASPPEEDDSMVQADNAASLAVPGLPVEGPTFTEPLFPAMSPPAPAPALSALPVATAAPAAPTTLLTTTTLVTTTAVLTTTTLPTTTVTTTVTTTTKLTTTTVATTTTLPTTTTTEPTTTPMVTAALSVNLAAEPTREDTSFKERLARSPSLFCWMRMAEGGQEEALVKTQLKYRLGIFGCDDFAVISNTPHKIGTLDGKNITTWGNNVTDSPRNEEGRYYESAQTFALAWDSLVHSGKLWSYNFTVKVDPDTVFLPDRLRQHLRGREGRPLYIANCPTSKTSARLRSALEVVSEEAMRSYQKDALKAKKCKSHQSVGVAEDRYFEECMEALDVEKVVDLYQVADPDCNTEVPCGQDDGRVAFHRYKKPVNWLQCYEDALSAPPAPKTSTFTTSSTETTTLTTTTLTTTGIPGPHPLLFCWTHMVEGTYEEKLLKKQLELRASIFACNDFAVISSSKVVLGYVGTAPVYTWVNPDQKAAMGQYGVNGMTTNSFMNTQTFLVAWDTLITSDKLWKFDFVVKVDPDAVFFPDRLRNHVKKDIGQAIYFPNCGKYGGEPLLYGSIEVFSVPALKVYEAREAECKNMDWHGWGEDYFMQTCMDMIGVKWVADPNQVADSNCVAASCTDWSKVAFHAFKTEDAWLSCYHQAIGQ